MTKTANGIVAFVAALTLALLADAPPVAAQNQQDGITVGQLVNNLNPLNWRMPQFRMPDFRGILPGNDEKARIKEKKDGFVGEVAKTASNSWQRTKQALSPARFLTASARMPSTKPAEKPKPGFFRSLFFPPPQPASDGTVTEFLSQPRVDP